jgi:DNA invertase Pin-like site-specific DNA recombinase
VAEGEAKAISDRTKAALQAAKARGVKLGSARPGHWDGHEAERAAGAAKGRVKSAEVRSKAAPILLLKCSSFNPPVGACGKSLKF